jgi:hypothetical protein
LALRRRAQQRTHGERAEHGARAYESSCCDRVECPCGCCGTAAAPASRPRSKDRDIPLGVCRIWVVAPHPPEPVMEKWESYRM